jgi:hypothetical protein
LAANKGPVRPCFTFALTKYRTEKYNTSFYRARSL